MIYTRSGWYGRIQINGGCCPGFFGLTVGIWRVKGIAALVFYFGPLWVEIVIGPREARNA
jgi:hypothetical protein